MTPKEPRYIFATTKPWHLKLFSTRRSELRGRWAVCASSEDLPQLVLRLAPRYVFFPHWSEIVPEAILNTTECVCFHMTDLPYGRGGSPLQNLIKRGHTETMLSALRMTPTLDGGPVYTKRPLSLAGSAHEIFERSAEITLDLIRWIVELEPRPQPQEGAPTIFARRRPSESRLPDEPEARQLYDHIRMLDAPGYPRAFIDYGPWQIVFTAAELGEDSVSAHAEFIVKDKTGED